MCKLLHLFPLSQAKEHSQEPSTLVREDGGGEGGRVEGGRRGRDGKEGGGREAGKGGWREGLGEGGGLGGRENVSSLCCLFHSVSSVV